MYANAKKNDFLLLYALLYKESLGTWKEDNIWLDKRFYENSFIQI